MFDTHATKVMSLPLQPSLEVAISDEGWNQIITLGLQHLDKLLHPWIWWKWQKNWGLKVGKWMRQEWTIREKTRGRRTYLSKAKTKKRECPRGRNEVLLNGKEEREFTWLWQGGKKKSDLMNSQNRSISQIRGIEEHFCPNSSQIEWKVHMWK